MKEYGVLYSRVLFPKGHKLEWLSHIMIDLLPKDLSIELNALVDQINDKYKDQIIIPLDKKLQAGCASTPESISLIASDLYSGLNNIFKNLTGDENCVRVVYGSLELDEEDINKVSSVHHIGNYSRSNYITMIKIGKMIDIKEPGLVKF